MKEIWKPVVGYEGYYEVSNLCRVRSVDRYVMNSHKNGFKRAHGIIKKTDICNMGREIVQLSKAGVNRRFPVYRLMAIAFLPNPENLPQINHKDENPLNNSLENLEWCSSKYNCNYGTRNRRISESKYKPIVIVDELGNKIKFISRNDAAKYLGVSNSSICVAIKRNRKIKNYKIVI